MGCTTSLLYKNGNNVAALPSLTSTIISIPLSEETKKILRESWVLVEPVKAAMGKKLLMRLFETHPRLQDTFPAFGGVALEDLINSRSLYLHSKRIMAAVENAMVAMNDAEVFISYLMNLGERHLPWSIKMEHLKMLEEALIWTLQDSLQSKCTVEVAKAWGELFDFIAETMMAGLRRVKNT